MEVYADGYKMDPVDIWAVPSLAEQAPKTIGKIANY